MLPFFKPKKGFMVAGGGLETSAGGGGGGGGSAVDYSTTETDTDVKWIDGKKVYRKVIVIPNGTYVGSDSINTNISNISKILDVRIVFHDDVDTYINDLRNGLLKLNRMTKTGLVKLSGSGSSYEINGTTKTANIVVEYTKESEV